LIRFQTDGSAVWFKAVGEPNTREFRVTMELTARFPSHLPVPIATCSDWNAWLTKEAAGQDLFNCMEMSAWERAAESLADLQIASIEDTPDILAAGGRDVRVAHLLGLADPFFEVMERTMQRQTKAAPPPLHPHEINRVKEHVISLLHEMEFTHIPDTLNHLDPNPGNIFVSERTCTFLDWADAAVGNPFFSFEYLRQHFLRTFPTGQAAEAKLCHSYLSRWSSILPDKTAEQMMRITPLAALFAYAASALLWNETNAGNPLELQAFLRSLGRRMRHESEYLRKAVTESRAGGENHDDDVASVLGTSES
jgi:aminoglycoside phosphotransferase (APT) family kinase protein